jgi:predicted RNase H-like HicB family nuclease
MAEQLDLTIVYEPGEDGWIIASIPEVAGVFSQGRSREEARTNVIDALRLMLSSEPSGTDDRSVVPRHREIDYVLARKICRQLQVPPLAGSR